MYSSTKPVRSWLIRTDVRIYDTALSAEDKDPRILNPILSLKFLKRCVFVQKFDVQYFHYSSILRFVVSKWWHEFIEEFRHFLQLVGRVTYRIFSFRKHTARSFIFLTRSKRFSIHQIVVACLQGIQLRKWPKYMIEWNGNRICKNSIIVWVC